MTAAEAMADVVLRATQLSLTRQFARDNPSAENQHYSEVIKGKYDEAFKRYTDPFGTKTYA